MKTITRLCFAILLIFSPMIYADQPSTENMQSILKSHNIKSVSTRNFGAIVPGAGYSHDSQQIAPNLCYNTVVTATTGQQGVVNLNSAMSFSDFERKLHFNVDVKGGYGMFSAEAEADYLRTLQDLEYTLSLNYFEFLFDSVMIRLAGPGHKALTETGMTIYTDHKIKKLFGLLCGDEYISMYQQGALLLMNIKIHFKSHLDKQEFKSKVGGSFGNLVSASTEIQNVARKYNMQGIVIMQAYQKGGNPAELSKILTRDSRGTYYALSCDIQHMDNCVKAASGLLNYAVEYFPQQISFNPDKGLVPLGTGFLKHDPITEYGLTPPPSLVNKEVVETRNQLANLLNENQFYKQKLEMLMNGYIEWDKKEPMYKTIVDLHKIAVDNIDHITLPNNPDDGAIKCYNHPTFCKEVVNSIRKEIKPIAPQLGFMNDLATIVSMDYFNTNYWYPAYRPGFYLNKDQRGTYYGNMTITNDSIKDVALYVVYYRLPWTWVRGNLDRRNNVYFGKLCSDNRRLPCRDFTMQVLANPFYFTAYKPEE